MLIFDFLAFQSLKWRTLTKAILKSQTSNPRLRQSLELSALRYPLNIRPLTKPELKTNVISLSLSPLMEMLHRYKEFMNLLD